MKVKKKKIFCQMKMNYQKYANKNKLKKNKKDNNKF